MDLNGTIFKNKLQTNSQPDLKACSISMRLRSYQHGFLTSLSNQTTSISAKNIKSWTSSTNTSNLLMTILKHWRQPSNRKCFLSWSDWYRWLESRKTQVQFLFLLLTMLTYQRPMRRRISCRSRWKTRKRTKVMMYNKPSQWVRLRTSKILEENSRLMTSICLRGWTWLLMSESRISHNCLDFLKINSDATRDPASTDLESDTISCAMLKLSNSRMIQSQKFQRIAFSTLWATNFAVPQGSQDRTFLDPDNTTPPSIWQNLERKPIIKWIPIQINRMATWTHSESFHNQIKTRITWKMVSKNWRSKKMTTIKWMDKQVKGAMDWCLWPKFLMQGD